MEDKKYVKKSYLLHQYEEEELFLSEMRREGWKFVNLYRGIPTKYEFEKCEPEEYIYQLDYIEKENDTEDYHQLLKDSGWEQVMPWDALGGKWYYYCKKGNSSNDRLYTDYDSKLQLFNTLWKRYSVLLLVCALIELNSIRVFVDMLIRESHIMIILILAIIGIVFCGSIIIFMVYCIGASISKKAKLEKQRNKAI